MFSTAIPVVLALSIPLVHASPAFTTTGTTITRLPRAESTTTTTLSPSQASEVANDLSLYANMLTSNPSYSSYASDFYSHLPSSLKSQVDHGETEWQTVFRATATPTWYTEMPEAAQSFWNSVGEAEQSIVVFHQTMFTGKSEISSTTTSVVIMSTTSTASSWTTSVATLSTTSTASSWPTSMVGDAPPWDYPSEGSEGSEVDHSSRWSGSGSVIGANSIWSWATAIGGGLALVALL